MILTLLAGENEQGIPVPAFEHCDDVLHGRDTSPCLCFREREGLESVEATLEFGPSYCSFRGKIYYEYRSKPNAF